MAVLGERYRLGREFILRPYRVRNCEVDVR
jgi:hypothetical protein